MTNFIEIEVPSRRGRPADSTTVVEKPKIKRTKGGFFDRKGKS